MKVVIQVGNLFRGHVPPRTAWVARVEYDHVLVPQDVDAALERYLWHSWGDFPIFHCFRFYERVISEHLDSWYRDLSHDEEFLQVDISSFHDHHDPLHDHHLHPLLHDHDHHDHHDHQ